MFATRAEATCSLHWPIPVYKQPPWVFYYLLDRPVLHGKADRIYPVGSLSSRRLKQHLNLILGAKEEIQSFQFQEKGWSEIQLISLSCLEEGRGSQDQEETIITNKNSRSLKRKSTAKSSSSKSIQCCAHLGKSTDGHFQNVFPSEYTENGDFLFCVPSVFEI